MLRANIIVVLVWGASLFTQVAADLVISEFLASNVANLLDKDGEPSDWVEIRNTGTASADLSGLTLTDNKAIPNQWAFPSGTTLPADSYLVVFCSSKNLAIAGSQLHTNFKLGAGGEYLGLYNGPTVLSEYSPAFPVQTDDRSYGIDRNGDRRYFSTPTPGSANGVGDLPVAAVATASVNRGFYTNPFTVTLTTAEAGAQIRYTLNGSEPTQSNGSIYNSPISVSTTTILRAATFASGTLASPVSTYSYIFLEDVLDQPANIPGFPNGAPRATGRLGTVPLDMAMDSQIVNAYSGEILGAMTAIPTLSLTTGLDKIFGSTGFYLNEVEQKVSIEILHRNPAKNQQIDVGAEPHSHNRLKRSIRLNFRTEYGNREWDTTLFRDFPINGGSATNKIRTVVLRGGNNRSWARSWNPDATTYTEDEFYRSTYLAMNGSGSHGTFLHLYLNGVYWGVYNMVERPDNDFAAGYLGGDKDSWFYTNHDGAGNLDPTRWNYLTGALANKPMSNAQNYQEMQQYLDVRSFADYILASFFVGLTDWPTNNWYVALRNANDPLGPTPARFYAWDGEWSLDRRLLAGDGAAIPPEFISCISTTPIVKLWCSLQQSQDFRSLFSSRVAFHTQQGGALSTAAAVARFDAINSFIESAIIGESARWGDSLRALGGQYAVTRTRNEDWRSEVNVIRNLLQLNTNQLINTLRNAGFYPQGPSPIPAPIAPVPPTPVSLPVPIAPAPAPVPTPSSVISLILVNANTDTDIGPVTNGMTISLASVGSALNIRVQPVTPAGVKSVVFNYDGINVRTENGAPYTFAGDVNGNYNSWTPSVGQHTVTATAFSATGGTGSIVGAVTVTFTVTVSGPAPIVAPVPAPVVVPVPVVAPIQAPNAAPIPAPVVVPVAAPMAAPIPVATPVQPPAVSPVQSPLISLYLVNAATGLDVGILTNGMTIALGSVGRSLNVRLQPLSPSGVGSVVFNYDGLPFRTENGAPFTLAGDSSGKYNSWTPSVGTHAIVATAFTGKSGLGGVVARVSVSFTVI